jgi:predicted 3-demethylubiquinone-9 3-methyltransferase (glyoxalase superfamily)
MSPSSEPKIVPFLWFDNTAAEAAKFYASIFKDARIESESEMSVTIWLHGQKLILFNGGPMFTFTEAMSMLINCETQAEVDELWEKLSAGGETSRCGWLKDKFGLSWQVVPTVLFDLLSDDDDEKSNRAMQAMLTMSKLDIAELKKAFDG